MYCLICFSEMSIDVNKSDNQKILYGSLFDIMCKSKDDLVLLTDSLEKAKLFNFYNTGKYAGYDEKAKKHFTFDDGNKRIYWLIQLGKFADALNHNGHNIKITLSKQLIMDKGITDFSKPYGKDKVGSKEKIIASYIYALDHVFKSAKLNVFECKALGKLYKEIPCVISNDYLYIKI